TAVAPAGMRGAPRSYAELATTAPVANLVLRFTSPTTFRQAGDHFLHPTPRLVFGSHLRRWRAFAPVALDALSLARLEHIRLVEVDLQHIDVDLTVARHPAITGWARYRVDGADDAFARQVATLAAYAAYCGTGARTSFGMGQTEWLA
ncbi:MAG: CRISPR system precrRNA processing endoribonuclease RAMP protein Cas6, partial [Chloroflexia bacterium]|nr:CRISPR system precrRNA processing endoribonuclease RAMP protein Cas6 [Chloroflexia bacterium]